MKEKKERKNKLFGIKEIAGLIVVYYSLIYLGDYYGKVYISIISKCIYVGCLAGFYFNKISLSLTNSITCGIICYLTLNIMEKVLGVSRWKSVLLEPSNVVELFLLVLLGFLGGYVIKKKNALKS